MCMYVFACVCVYVCVCECVCVCCVCQRAPVCVGSVLVRACVFVCLSWGGGRLVQWFLQSNSIQKIVRSIPTECSNTRLYSPSLSLRGYQEPKVCVRVMGKPFGKKKKKKGFVTRQKQPLRAVWCKTKLVNSGGQFDQLCNLINGAILAQIICKSTGLSLSTTMCLQKSNVLKM